MRGEGGLTGPHLATLSRLDRHGPMTSANMPRCEQISPQAMGATVAGLEKLGLVAHKADAADGRRLILTLTPEGRTVIRSGRDAVVERIAAVLEESFTDEEAAILGAAAPLLGLLADLL
jgi:DNA-binding MarR family transcriptional regulator